MRWEQVKEMQAAAFQRATGVKRRVFEMMVDVVKKDRQQRRKRARFQGQQAKLKAEDQILVTLMYLREYRTQFHIRVSYGISEATVNRTIRYVESILLKDERFHLPGKKKLYGDPVEIEAVVVDVSETPIERPKKSKDAITQARRKSTL